MKEFKRNVKIISCNYRMSRCEAEYIIQDSKGVITKEYLYVPADIAYKVGSIVAFSGFLDERRSLQVRSKFVLTP